MENCNFNDRTALHGKIIEKYGTMQAFAAAFDCTYTHMLNLLNGKTNWSLDGARKAAKLLGIDGDASELKRIFFYFSN